MTAVIEKESLSDLVSAVDLSRVPEHIAIIMDGNRRWAQKRNLSTLRGHYEGAEALTRIVRAASELGVKALTVYTFSTENWLRTPYEVRALMSLLKVYLLTKREMMRKEGVRLDMIGDLSKFPPALQEIFYHTKEATKGGNKIDLILALNYGGRAEIARAFSRMLEDYERDAFTKEEVDETLISRYLDTKNRKDPDLLIRTSGELRISNFMLWQVSYAEIHITEVFWPDFTKKDLVKAILDYQKRERRWGGA